MDIFQKLVTKKNKSYVHSQGNYYTYDCLIKDAEKFRSFIENRPLVFIVAKNIYDCLTGYVGCIRSNAVVALISDTIREPMMHGLLGDFKPAYVYQPKNIFQCEKNWKNKFEFGEYVLYETKIEKDYEINEELSLLLMTSGSTGSPEFVRLSRKNINSNTQAICEYLKISDNDVAITTLPMSYSYGISILNTHLFKGASLILTDESLMQKRFWELISNHKVTTFGGVPYTYKMLKKLKFEKISLPSVKYITQAGGQLDKKLLNYISNSCLQKGIEFFVMYGQTEASPRMSYLPPSMVKEKLGSIGVSLPGGKFYLIDNSHKIIDEPDVEGELVYEGENVSLGYAKNCYDLAKGDLNKGILETGDIARMDSDGYYYITGRKKRFLKLFGNRISLDQIEQKLNEAGYNCVCVGLDDQMKIYTDKESNIKKIYKFTEKNFNLNKSALKIIFLNVIPRNNSGKILYSEIEKLQ